MKERFEASCNAADCPFRTTLYGSSFNNYRIDSTPSLAAPIIWTPFTNITLSNLSEAVSLPPATNSAQFFRAVQQ